MENLEMRVEALEEEIKGKLTWLELVLSILGLSLGIKIISWIFNFFREIDLSTALPFWF